VALEVKKPALHVHCCSEVAPVAVVAELAGQDRQAATDVAPAPVR
jgi:hypothetical protein